MRSVVFRRVVPDFMVIHVVEQQRLAVFQGGDKAGDLIDQGGDAPVIGEISPSEGMSCAADADEGSPNFSLARRFKVKVRCPEWPDRAATNSA